MNYFIPFQYSATFIEYSSASWIYYMRNLSKIPETFGAWEDRPYVFKDTTLKERKQILKYFVKQTIKQYPDKLTQNVYKMCKNVELLGILGWLSADAAQKTFGGSELQMEFGRKELTTFARDHRSRVDKL